tara:strand:+ start:273 stop:569 length:297 start_codon:yes stop_codon:yes gene_type:complete
MFGKRRKIEYNYEKTIESLHRQILSLQTENKSLRSTIVDIEEVQNTNTNKYKAEIKSLNVTIDRQKRDINDYKLRYQYVNTKLHKIRAVLDSKINEVV